MPAKETPAETVKREIERVSDSECQTEEWRRLAKHYPFEAQANPSAGLFSLEDPSLYSWHAIEQEYARDWIGFYAATMSRKSIESWAADCAERVLFIHEQAFPGNTEPLNTIKLRRAFAEGEIPYDQWEAASITPGQGHYTDAPHYASDSTRTRDAVDASWSAYRALKLNGGDYVAESIWQWRRMLDYLKAEDSSGQSPVQMLDSGHANSD